MPDYIPLLDGALEQPRTWEQYRGRTMNYEDILVVATEMQMAGKRHAAYRFVEMKVNELESEVRFPWTNSPRYRDLVALRERIADVTFFPFNVTGAVSGRTSSSQPNLHNIFPQRPRHRVQP